MADIITHRRTRIVTLAPEEQFLAHCIEDDIALVPDGSAWWVHFVGPDGTSDTYDEAFPTYNEALWAAKAAAEFNSSL